MRTQRVIGTLLIMMSVIIAVVLLMFVQHDANEKKHNDTVIKHVATRVIQRDVQARSLVDPNMLRRVDFAKLERINHDATRWMFVPNTKLDAPVMQERTVGRYYYTFRSILRYYNGCGSFLTPAEPTDSSTRKPADDAHLLIFGHRMGDYNGEYMFSKLPSRWSTMRGAKQYPYVYIYYPDRAERYRVWTAAVLQGSDKVYDTPYTLNSHAYKQLIEHLQRVGKYRVGDKPDMRNRILVMSTCNTPSPQTHWRFILVSALDATYHYTTKQYVNQHDMIAYTQWRNGVEKQREQAITNAQTLLDNSSNTQEEEG